MKLLSLFKFLKLKHKIQTIFVLLFMIIGVALETLSIGTVIPLLSTLFNSEFYLDKFLNSYIGIEIGAANKNDEIIFLVLIFFTLFVLKNLYFTWFYFYQSTLVFDIRKEFSTKLYESYLRQPYSFFLKRNTSHLIQIIQDETMQLASNILLPTMLMITETLVLISILILIFFTISWTVLVAIILPFVGACILYFSLRNRLKKWGEKRHYHETMRIKNIQQGFGGIKEIKIMNREQEFINEFNFHNYESAIYLRNNYVVSNCPRLLFEVLGVLSILIMVVIHYKSGNSFENLIISLGIFGVAVLRIAPSAARIITSLQKIRFGRIIIDLIINELTNIKNDRQSNISYTEEIAFHYFIKIKNLSFKYNDSKNQILSKINLTIPKGSKVGIIGASGAGKTTLVNILLGLLTPTDGKIYADDVDILKCLKNWQSKIGYVPQQIYLADDSLRRNIAFGLSGDLINDDKIYQSIKMANLEDMVMGLDQGLDTVIGERGVRLSGGQQQRIGLARALYLSPSILILDEATSSLDINSEREILKAIYSLEKSITVVLIAHRLNTLDGCDIVYEITEDGVSNYRK